MNSFTNVTVPVLANVYFEGNVVSHSVIFPDASKKTLGIIYPGTYHFGTEAPELMEITAGSCVVVLDGSEAKLTIEADSSFEVPGNSGFTITVSSGLCQYICSFLPA